MNLREAAQQALEALTNCTSEYGHRCNRCDSEVDEGGKVVEALRAALAEEALQRLTDVQQDMGCDHCNSPLYAAVKCRVCGRVTEPVQDTGVKLKPVFYAPRRLDDAEIEDIIKRNAATTESILDINFKEPQPGMVNLDAFRAFHFNDPPKGGFVGEIEMLKWLVRNRDGDYWKAKHGEQEPPCATQECMPSECPNCVSLQNQNTELDRKLAETERKPMNEFDALRLITKTVGLLQSAGPVEGLIGIIRAVERAHGIGDNT